MDRRDFLTLGGAVGMSGASALVLGSCASLPSPRLAAPPNVEDMHAYLAGLDRATASLENVTLVGDLAQSLRPDGTAPAGLEAHETLMRKSMRSLLLCGMFMDLNEHDRAHPDVQARMWAAQDELDDTVRSHAALLDALPQDARHELRNYLRDRPDTVTHIVNGLDVAASEAGVSAKRMDHLREVFGHVDWKLRNQDPSILIDDYVAKVRRAEARCAQSSVDVQGPDGIVAPPPAPWLPPPSTPGQSMAQSTAAPPAPVATNNGSKVATAGGIILGIGVVIGAIGALFVAAGSGVAVGVGAGMLTVGAIGLVAGLITLIIGAVMMASH